MLIFDRVVKADDTDMVVYVFVDEEKGHTVYLSPDASLTVTVDEKKSNNKDRVVGFLAETGCSEGSGC